jgi:hypothetical protein
MQSCLARTLDLEALHWRLKEEFAPVGEVELMLVDRVSELRWRLRRAARVETGLYTVFREEVEAREQLDAQRSSTGDPQAPDWVIRKIRGVSSNGDKLDDEAIPEADGESNTEQSLRLLGQAFLHDAGSTDAFGKLSRYQTTIERSFYRALRELERVQQARKSGEAATPVVVDGTVAEDPESST